MAQTTHGLGYALTVFRSPRIRRFDVHLIGELPDRGPSGISLIIARASGRFIDQIGGVPAGASGSPVYVDDQLIGAVSAVFAPDYRLIGITPMEAMLAIPSPSDTGDRIQLPTSNGHTLPIATGFCSQRAVGELRKHLGYDVQAAPVRASRAGLAPSGNIPLEHVEPGSPLGAAILVGDISFGSIGTATAIQKDLVWGFGHPAFFLGPVHSALTAPVILAVGHGPTPIKVGDLGPVIGTVTQDRSAGILGRLGMHPALVDLELTITDIDLDRTITVRTRSTPAPQWLSFMTFIATLESFHRAMDRVGAGTAIWDWTIKVPHRPELRTSGSAYDAFDIAGLVATTVDEPLNELLQSGEQILSIRLNAQVRIVRMDTETA